MEDTVDRMQTFLREFTEQSQSPSEDNSHPKILGNYSLHPEEISGQVIDWIFNYLENRKCPHQLALTIASKIAQQMSADQATIQDDEIDQKFPDLLTLYAEAIKKVPLVCASLLEKSNLKDECSVIFSPYSTSVFAIKNKRRKMEDRHVIHHDLNSLLDIKNAPHHSYYAVFDGHSGIDAASYASAQLHINIAKHPAFLTDTVLAISEAHKITDENFLKRCSKENVKSGCTSISALVRESTLYLSWLGDSQAVLVKQGKPVMITNPHKPDREDEKQRIESLGGHITCMGVWRVNGILAVTRAFGDPDHKPFISSEPEISVINLDQTEDFLILACDGLWDGMSPDDVTSALYSYLAESAVDEPLDTIAAKLVHQSKLQGSEDNITTVVVFLRDIKDIKEDAIKYMANLSQASAQMREFLSVNGEAAVGCTSSASNVPFTKPTVLELNAASSKKLKNTANVLSSAGLGNTSYSYPYSENPFHGVCAQIGSDFDNAQNIFMSQNTACFAPEATALSELPTPPIDDVLALQNFEKFSSSDLSQNLDSVTLETSDSFYISGTDAIKSLNESEISSQYFVSDVTAVQQVNNPIPSGIESEIIKNEFIESGAPQVSADIITPDEAVGIASSVVSNAIETAVKSLSSETQVSVTSQSSSETQVSVTSQSSSETQVSVTSQSPQKLNPYAEPFVMKSFFASEGNESKNENPVSEAISVNNHANLPSSLESGNFGGDELACPDVYGENPLDVNNPSLVSAIAEHSDMISSCENVEKNVTERLDNVANSSNLIDFDTSIMSDVKKSNTVQSPTNIDNLIISEPNLDAKADLNLDKNSESLHSEKNKIEPTSSASSEDVIGELISTASEKEDAVSTKELVSDKDKCKDSSDFLLPGDITKESISLLNIQNELLNPPEPVLPSDHIAVEGNVETSAVDLQSIPDGVPESTKDLVSDKDKCKDSSDLRLPGDITKESISLINMQNELLNPSEPVLPSDHIAEEAHVETFAVDLQSVPDGVPEAEGVTEDIDSDSEKDGGWSYMKGNADNSAKPKNEESSLKAEKPDMKRDSNSKLKKEISKPASDIKAKSIVKNIAADKAKKVDKKIVDVKEKEKSKNGKSSTLSFQPKPSTDRANRITSTVSRVKKETTSRITTTTTAAAPVVSKPTRPTVQRNAGISGKPTNVSNADKSQVSSKSSISSSMGATARPKTVPPVQESKTNIRPVSSIAKVQSVNQSNKSNATLRSAPNRLASSVPSKTSSVTKSLPLSKSTTESKPKQTVPTVKRTVPSLLKKPDVKETKDSFNKQISAGKSAVVNKVDSAATPVVSNKTSTVTSARRTTLNNRSTISKVSSATSVKTDLIKKDVPKIPSSKTSARSTAASKLSKDDVKGKDKKALVQTKSEEMKSNLASSNDHERNATEIVSEEEKFILETNDKETVIKEQIEISGETNQILGNSSLTECTKPVENQTPVPCSSESML